MEEATARAIKAQLASDPRSPKSFWYFCQLFYPNFYIEDREFLLDMCMRLQAFTQSDKKFLVMNLPPRHGKSLTAQAFTAWLFGLNPLNKVMTASYNERLSGIFARSVRNVIQTEPVDDNLVYSDIFPNTKVKYGEASSSMWSLEGNNQVNYLATSPGATATGLGVNYLIYDDLIKNAEEAYNENRLQSIYDWHNNTMMQRLEGDWKVIVIMTRWATGDLAGRILEDYDDVELIQYKAIQDDGSMLCESILDRKTFELKTKEMNSDIVEANFNQTAIDVAGRLYPNLNTYTLDDIDDEKWEDAKTVAICDTADTGNDYLCMIVYKVLDNEAYVVDVVFTQEDMDTTEQLVAESLFSNEVNEATFESNNGGRLFSSNVERRLKAIYGSNKTIIDTVTQSKNKEARILTSSAWVAKHVYLPKNWHARWREFYDQVTRYQKKGKNTHDDAVDVLAYIYEAVNDDNSITFYSGLSDRQNTDRAWFG